ncbi:MAG: hypothetical protein ACLGJD_06540 [Gammaproteobacteria bacterium]
MEKLKNFFESYPRSTSQILAILASIIIVISASVQFFSDPLVEIFDGKNPTSIKILVISALSGLIYLFIDVYYCILWRGASLRLARNLDTEISSALASKECSELCIFASGGEEALNILLKLCNENFIPARPIKIKVLLREDENEDRHAALQRLVDRWKKDLDEVTNQNKRGYQFTTEFSAYKLPVMLKGYIFGSSCAFLSWYARKPGLRSSPQIPMICINGKAPKSQSLIVESRQLFDHYFNTGVKIEKSHNF